MNLKKLWDDNKILVILGLVGIYLGLRYLLKGIF